KIYGEENIDRERAACRLRQEDNSTISFLIDNWQTVRNLRNIIEVLTPRSKYFDEVRRRFVNAITKQSAKLIYRHVTVDGLLKLYQRKPVPMFGIDGNPIVDSNGEPA